MVSLHPLDHAHHCLVPALTTALPPRCPRRRNATLTVEAMTAPEDAEDLFVEAQAAFTPFLSAPNDDDVKRLNEVFINTLQSIDVPVGVVALSDILLTDEDHKATHGGNLTFERMEGPLQAYDDSIAADVNNAVCSTAKRLWTEEIELQRLIKTVERAGRAFLVAVVEDTWLLPLKEESTFYNEVPLRDFFARLKGGSGGLKATNIVSLLSTTLSWWADDPRVPEYVNRPENAQKNSVRAKLPIDDKWLAAINTDSLLAACN